VRLAATLARAGATVVGCSDADRGMGHSLACGVRAAGDARGWIVALADMPWIAPATIRAVVAALAGGAPIVVPRVAGERGHPVGFAAAFLGELTALQGDQGARSLLRVHAMHVVHVDVADRGAIRDVDIPADLAGKAG
jgi:molybdenum cofactor cytidylyltransferase